MTDLLDSYTFVDLTHPLTPNVPHWYGSCGFQHEIVLDYDECKTATKFRAQRVEMQSGIGTHMDAPLHCFSGGSSIADLPLNHLIAPSVVIDVSAGAHTTYKASVADILAFEKIYGKIRPGVFVIFYTGWEQLWHTPEKYHNTWVFPSVSKEAAELLLERDIRGLGIDTLSPDRPEDDFPVHHLVLGAGKYIVENIANAKQLAPVDAYTFALPIKIQDGTEAPVRLIGMSKVG